MRKSLGFFLFAIFSMFSVGSVSAQPVPSTSPAPTAKESRFIEVDANAQIDAVPDLVDLHLRLQVEQATPKQATQELLQRRQKLVDALFKAGLSKPSLTMSHLHLNIRYKRYGKEIRGYEASVSLVACIQKIERLSEFVEVAAQAGVTGFSTQFRSTHGVSIKKKLREMALKAAYEKALQIAQVTGVRLGQVRFVREVQTSSYHFSGLTNAYESGRLRSAQTNVQPGAIPMRFSIRVAYTIQ